MGSDILNREKKIKILSDIIKIRSINDNEIKVAEYFQKLFEGSKVKTKIQKISESRANFIGDLNGDSEILGFTGHMDVVSCGDETKWTHGPFSADIEDGKIYGRGTSDMKAGVVAMAIALLELSEEGFEGSLRLLGTLGEEVGQEGSKKLAEAGYVDDLKGLLIGEPSFKGNYSEVAYAHMGSFNYKFTAHGKSSHSSMPELGINAIDHILDFSKILKEKMEDVSHKYINKTLGRTIFNITMINGGNQINSVPELASLEGNIRTIPEFNNDKIEALFKNLLDEFNKKGHNLELEITQSSYAVESDRDNALVKAIVESEDKIKLEDLDNLENLDKDFIEKLKAQKKINIPLGYLRPVTDGANFYTRNNNMDFAVYGPGQVDLAHQVDEYAYIDRYLHFIDLYKKVAKNYLKK